MKIEKQLNTEHYMIAVSYFCALANWPTTEKNNAFSVDSYFNRI